METKMNISDLVWDEKIYPREKTNEKTIDAYCEALDAGAQFPPIEVQRVRNYPEREGEIFIILDGVHRYDPYRRRKVEEIEVKDWRPEAIDYKENQIMLLLEAAERNRNHGDRLTENDKKGVARSIAEGDPKRTFTEKQIADKLGVIQETVSNWISDIRARQRASRNAKIIYLSRLGWSQEEIAEVMGKDRSIISRIVQNTKFGEMHSFLEQGKDMAWIADHYHIDIPLTWALCLEGKTDQERFEGLGWGLRTWDQWSFNTCDERFGEDWPARLA